MSSFRYSAVDRSGRRIGGTIEAEDQPTALSRLRSEGLLPIWAGAAEETLLHRFTVQLAQLLPGRVGAAARPQTVAAAMRELSNLLRAGLDLDKALSVLIAFEAVAPLKPVLSKARTQVQSGQPLSAALAASGAFSPLVISFLRAGEAGGGLTETISRLAECLETASQTRSAITSALIYPAVMIATALLSVGFLVVFVLPEFAGLFEGAGKPMPLPPRLMMQGGQFIAAYWWALLSLVAIGAFGLDRMLSRPEVRRRFDVRRLSLPVYGPIHKAVELERITRTLGMLLRNGVALPVALRHAKDITGNRALADALAAAEQGLREGEPLSRRFQASGLMPAMMVDLTRVGEESGKLDVTLLRLADYFAASSKTQLERTMSLAVPVLTIVLGLLVGGIIASMLSAVMGINDAVF